MKIEYIVKDSDELKRLEAAFKNFPCVISPDNIALEVALSTMKEKLVVITPKHQGLNIEGVIGKPKEAGFVGLDYSNLSQLVVEREGYRYIINLKRDKK